MDSSCAVADGSRETIESPDVRARALVIDHFKFIWRLLRRSGVPEQDADDLAQHVFMVVTAKIDDVEPGRERSFLVGVALRTAAEARRRTKRSRVEQNENAVVAALDPGPGPEEVLDQRRAMVLLDALLDRVPERLRTIFVLHELERLTTRDIAELLDLPEGTVASRLRRGREVFQERIGQLRQKLSRRRVVP